MPVTAAQVMVRPRPGDFLYTDGEIEVMLEDIGAFKAAGATGVVFGVLDASGRVDAARSRWCVPPAYAERALSV
jgi:copper homeostasis protein